MHVICENNKIYFPQKVIQVQYYIDIKFCRLIFRVIISKKIYGYLFLWCVNFRGIYYHVIL